MYGKIIKLDDGRTLILNNNFKLRDTNKKIVNRLMSNEKNLKTIRKSVFAILKTVKSLTFPIVLVQTLFLRNVIFNLFFEGNLKKGYDLTNVLLSYFSNSYLLIFIVLLLKCTKF